MKKLFSFIILLSLLSLSIFAEDLSEADTTSPTEPVEDTPAPTRGLMNAPEEIKAFWIYPGVDYAIKSSDSQETVEKQIEGIMSTAVDYGFNSVFVPLESADGVIYASSTRKTSIGFDAFEYILKIAGERDIIVYPVFSAEYQMSGEEYVAVEHISSDVRTDTAINLEDFIKIYDVEAIFLAGYQNIATADSMATYRSEGGGMGYENWMSEGATSLLSSLVSIIKNVRPETGVGIITDPVWANVETNSAGSKTIADYEMLTDGHIDIDKILNEVPIDAVAVKSVGSLTDTVVPFEEVMNWWGSKAQSYEIPAIAIIINENLGGEGEGWESPDQVMRQVIATREMSNVIGASFHSYTALQDNHEDSTEVLIRYYNNMVKTSDILTDLTLSRPEKQEMTTFETEAHFYGASDPNFPLYLNGQELERNEKGVFSVAIPLDAGKNTFVFEHKEKEEVYTITREVQIFGDVSPSGAVTVEGGVELTLSAEAYIDSTVTAEINGQRITLSPSDVQSDEMSGANTYITYTGTYKIPTGNTSSTAIGNIEFTGVWDGITQSKTGAAVTIASNVVVDTGHLVMVTADQARTYPSDTLNADPWGNYFPLPQGTLDYVVSDLLTYQSGDESYNYYKLKSGYRIDARDVTSQGVQPGIVSTISAASFTADSSYAYLTVTPSQKTAFVSTLTPLSFNNDTGLQGNFAATSLSILVKYSTLAPEAIPLITQNTIFSGVSMVQEGEDVRITLSLASAGRFLGYVAYYDSSGNLVFRFNQYPSSPSELKVYIDPGHGGNDPGAIPIPGMKSEKDLNYEMATKVADILRAAGVQVQMTETTLNNPSLDDRRAASMSYSPHIFVSLHHNSSYSPTATGTEVWYFNPYSKSAAASISSAISGSVGLTNRGAKYGWYRVASHMNFPAMLVEYGFLSNPSEYELLRTDANQNAMAQATADAILASFGF